LTWSQNSTRWQRCSIGLEKICEGLDLEQELNVLVSSWDYISFYELTYSTSSLKWTCACVAETPITTRLLLRYFL